MLRKQRIEILIIAILTLIGFLYIISLLKGEKDLHVPYNAHTFEMHKDYNENLVTDIRSFWINDEVYFVVPHDMPKYCTISITDETDFSTHEEEINIDTIESINDKVIHIIRSNLPIMYVLLDHSSSENPFQDLNDTNTPKDQYYYGTMAINNSGALPSNQDTNYNYIDDKTNLSKTYSISLSRHGNASWDMCGKHSFNIKLSEKDSLLGLYNSKTYTLIGNGKDKTLLRNYMANELAKKLNCDYTVDMKFVTLYVDNTYRGVYLLSEKPKKVIEKAIKESFPETFAINIMSTEKEHVIPFSTLNDEFSGDEGQSGGNGISAGLILPEENLLPNEYYEYKVQQLMDELGTGTFSNIDLDSFVKYYWVQEVTKNYDAWYRSFYSVYNSKTNSWTAGPPWDFDMSWNYFESVTPVDFYTHEGLIGSHGLYSDLFLDEDVKNAIYKSYNNDVRPALASLRKEMLDMYKYLYNDAYCDYEYINTDRNIPICDEKYFDYVFGTSYKNAFENYLDFFDKRNAYLNSIYIK